MQGVDIEPNGLALCSLHHKLFDLGAFTVEPSAHRVVFRQHAISGGRGVVGELPGSENSTNRRCPALIPCWRSWCISRQVAFYLGEPVLAG